MSFMYINNIVLVFETNVFKVNSRETNTHFMSNTVMFPAYLTIFHDYALHYVYSS